LAIDEMKTCSFITFGCKINQYETEAVREEVLALGLDEVPPGEPADVVVVNACSVTGASGAKSRRAVLRISRENPAARIVVMGCATPREKDLLRKIPGVAALVGNGEKGTVAALIRDGFEGPPAGPRDVLDLRVDRLEGRTRAYVKVQDGCDGFCSFCIIPFLRGRSRSRPLPAVLDELRRLAAGGCREIVVTGIHLQDWGADLEPPASLAGLLAELGRAARAEGIRRVRLSSLGPAAFGTDLVDALADPVFCPHWHLPLQSGDDGVLAAMRRGYGRDGFLAAVGRLEARFPRPSITTDVIVGHPGETGAAFEATLEVCRAAGFSRIHVFPFSPREGTRSARLPGRVPGDEVRRREKAVEDLGRELALGYKRRFLGETVEVLVEGDRPESPGTAEGYTDRYLRVRFPVADRGPLRNRFVTVRAGEARPDLLLGVLEAGGPAGGEEATRV